MAPLATTATTPDDPSPELVQGLDLSPKEPEEQQYPPSLYCSVTRQILQEPVVGPTGDSMEKAVVTGDAVALYPNRALQAYVDQLMKQSDNHSLPDSFYCPITFQLIWDPKIDRDGYTYEKHAIEQWIQVDGSSPVTRKPLALKDLYDNNALRDLLRTQLQHPVIVQWRENIDLEEPPTTMIVEKPCQTTRSPVASIQQSFFVHRIQALIVMTILLAVSFVLLLVVRTTWSSFAFFFLIATCATYFLCAVVLYEGNNNRATLSV